MDFRTAARIASYLSKDYAEDFFGLLARYHDVSASEAASRLGLHVQTAQDFLDGLAELEIVSKQKVREKKRPYYRYTLIKQTIEFKLDLTEPGRNILSEEADLERKVRERAGSGARFFPAHDGQSINSVTLWVGEGREGKERKISLTPAQGRFLFNMPFPNAEMLRIADVMTKAKIGQEYLPEILDIIDILEKHGVIEVQ
jgi:predicted transcriptional regulator